MFIPFLLQQVTVQGREGEFLAIRIDRDRECADLVGLDHRCLMALSVPFAMLEAPRNETRGDIPRRATEDRAGWETWQGPGERRRVCRQGLASEVRSDNGGLVVAAPTAEDQRELAARTSSAGFA